MKHQESPETRKLVKKIIENIQKLSTDRLESIDIQIRAMENAGKKKAVGIKEAANIMGVCVDTIRRAIKNGSLNAFQISEHGVWRISINELNRFLDRRK